MFQCNSNLEHLRSNLRILTFWETIQKENYHGLLYQCTIRLTTLWSRALIAVFDIGGRKFITAMITGQRYLGSGFGSNSNDLEILKKRIVILISDLPGKWLALLLYGEKTASRRSDLRFCGPMKSIEKQELKQKKLQETKI